MAPTTALRHVRRETRVLLDTLIASLPKRRRGQHRGRHPYRQMGYFATGAKRRG